MYLDFFSLFIWGGEADALLFFNLPFYFTTTSAEVIIDELLKKDVAHVYVAECIAMRAEDVMDMFAQKVSLGILARSFVLFFL